MGLALRLEKESINSINSHKDDYMNKVFDFIKFKDLKSYVDFINKEKFFTFTLTVTEGSAALEKEPIFKTREEFEAFVAKNEHFISGVKKYPNTKLKKKYMRLDDEELEAFEFLKLRYKQIEDKEYVLNPEVFEDGNSENKNENNPKNDKKPLEDRMYLVLGALYDSYADVNADFMTPFVKKILKKAFIIAKKYGYIMTSSMENLIKINSVSYKRALDELAK